MTEATAAMRDEAIEDDVAEAQIAALGDNIAIAKDKAVKLVDAITGQTLKKKDAVRFDDLRPQLADYIRVHNPKIGHDDYISRQLIDDYRGRYISELLVDERGELSTLEGEVVESLRTHDTLAENVEEDYDEHRSIGDRVADVVAAFGGSWTFIISFCVFLAVWMVFNVIVGDKKAPDPYPFILLNLILSTIAAFQAPIIMMSQRRTEAKDRLRAHNDYKVNLKAELEIRHLHEKVDHLLNRQWERLTEIQQIQIEMMLDQAKTANRVVKVRKVIKRKARKAPKPAANEETSAGGTGI